MLLQGKQPIETSLQIWAQYNGRIKSYGPFQPILWSCRWYDLNGHRRRGVGRDPTVRTKSYRPFQPVLWLRTNIIDVD